MTPEAAAAVPVQMAAAVGVVPTANLGGGVARDVAMVALGALLCALALSVSGGVPERLRNRRKGYAEIQ